MEPLRVARLSGLDAGDPLADLRARGLAGDLAETHGLRSCDAVHLATALVVDAQSLLLATWDRDVARGAVAAGCSASPPPTPR